jgi:flavin reductase (DIM6/NTAB) family NADH-FMN oxidoreductase RutF
MSIAGDQFRLTMGQLATGVTVVTVRDGAGLAHGMTASSVASLSLAPPMLLVCIDRDAAIHGMIVGAPEFGITILSADQEEVARRFADRDRHAFADGEWATSPAGLPLLAGGLAHLDCRRSAVYDGGDHSIVTGTVEWAEVREAAPLCYFRSRYGRIAL